MGTGYRENFRSWVLLGTGQKRILGTGYRQNFNSCRPSSRLKFYGPVVKNRGIQPKIVRSRACQPLHQLLIFVRYAIYRLIPKSCVFKIPAITTRWIMNRNIIGGKRSWKVKCEARTISKKFERILALIVALLWKFAFGDCWRLKNDVRIWKIYKTILFLKFLVLLCWVHVDLCAVSAVNY